MAKRLFFTFLILIFLFSNYHKISAYDDKTTHPALTDEIVDFYNLSFPDNQLTSQQKEWIVEGSILEDTPPRWINHFYDPIYKVGWTGEKAGNISSSTIVSWATAGLLTESPVSAVDWANNQALQQVYYFYQGDHTWQKALEYYASDNQEQAYKTLGYTLHLLEDQSVPDHTRNDTHAHELEKITGDYGSPYEEYLKKYTRQTIKNNLNIADNLKKENLSPIIKPSIEDYLISLATYSNNYFFSKDTINDPKYQNPKIIRDDDNFGYGIDENNNEFILTRVWFIKSNNKIIKTFVLDKNDNNIVDQYFSRLSRQAVLNGAGAINLFKTQAQDALVKNEYPAHLVKYDTSIFNIPMISFTAVSIKMLGGISTTYNAISNLMGNIFSFGNNNNNANNTQNTQANIINQINNVNQSSSAANQQTQVQSQQNQSSSQNQLTIQNNSNQQINNQPSAQILNNAQQTNQSNNQLSISQIQSQLLNIQAQANSLLQQLNNIKSQNQNNASNNQNQSISQTIFYGGVSATTQAVNQNSQSTDQVQDHQEAGNQEITSDLSGATSTITSVSTSTSTQNQAIQSQSASSSSSAAQSANHIVISEIQAGTDNNPDDEFIELYNPTSNDISLGGFSLKRRVSKNATSTKNLALNFSATSTISAKSFFLISHKDYSGSIAPDIIYSNNSNPLAYKDDIVFLEDNIGAVIDEVYYAEIPKGKSLERKANAISTADSMAIGGDRFSGNGYDTDGVDDFVLRDNPSPQNSSNFPEPRNAPTVPPNFNIQYNATTTELIFNWQASQDYSGATSTLAYNIFDVDNPNLTYRIGHISSASAYMTTSTIQISASTTLNIYIDEIGRSYNFSIQATDKEGLSSASSSAAISIPSFLPNIYFYKDPRASSTDYLIEAFYDQYPFVPDLYQDNANTSWKILVFYLNSEPAKEPMIDSFSSYPFNKPYNNLLAVKYPRCSGDNYYSVGAPSEFLILPDISARCGIWGGTMNLAMNYPFEDNHFIIRAASSSLDAVFTPNDYITAAYYSFYHSSWWAGAGEYFQLEAIDKTKHYFGNAPNHQPPTEPADLTAILDSASSSLIVNWENSTDPDSIDSLIKYELNFGLSDEPFDENNWQEVGKSFAQTKDEGGNYILVQTGPIIPIDIDYINSSDSYYNIYIRAKDEFGNTAVSSTTWPLQAHLQ